MEKEIPQDLGKSRWKIKLVLVFVIIIIGLGSYGYFWYEGVQKRDQEARNNIEKVEKYMRIQTSIAAEYERCQQLITKNVGNFADFEYCKKFINWADLQD